MPLCLWSVLAAFYRVPRFQPDLHAAVYVDAIQLLPRDATSAAEIYPVDVYVKNGVSKGGKKKKKKGIGRDWNHGK